MYSIAKLPREFMMEKQIPKSLRKRIREYMEQLYKAKTGYNVREVLDQLPPTLSVRNERSGNKYLTPIINLD